MPLSAIFTARLSSCVLPPLHCGQTTRYCPAVYLSSMIRRCTSLSRTDPGDAMPNVEAEEDLFRCCCCCCCCCCCRCCCCCFCRSCWYCRYLGEYGVAAELLLLASPPTLPPTPLPLLLLLLLLLLDARMRAFLSRRAEYNGIEEQYIPPDFRNATAAAAVVAVACLRPANMKLLAAAAADVVVVVRDIAAAPISPSLFLHTHTHTRTPPTCTYTSNTQAERVELCVQLPTHTHTHTERERRRRRRKEKKIGISAAVTPRIQFSNVREFLPSRHQPSKKKIHTHLTVFY